MAEDGSEEIMFICKWPLPVASADGVALAARAMPCPHFVFIAFQMMVVLPAFKSIVYYMSNVLQRCGFRRLALLRTPDNGHAAGVQRCMIR